MVCMILVRYWLGFFCGIKLLVRLSSVLLIWLVTHWSGLLMFCVYMTNEMTEGVVGQMFHTGPQRLNVLASSSVVPKTVVFRCFQIAILNYQRSRTRLQARCIVE